MSIAQAWESETRRSVSWLLYLSDDDCRGGELLAYCRHGAESGGEGEGGVGAHEGNLQVGWLGGAGGGGADAPVFLDAWVRGEEAAAADEDDDDDEAQQPLAALYKLSGGQREYLSEAFGAASPDVRKCSE